MMLYKPFHSNLSDVMEDSWLNCKSKCSGAYSTVTCAVIYDVYTNTVTIGLFAVCLCHMLLLGCYCDLNLTLNYAFIFSGVFFFLFFFFQSYALKDQRKRKCVILVFFLLCVWVYECVCCFFLQFHLKCCKLIFFFYVQPHTYK